MTVPEPIRRAMLALMGQSFGVRLNDQIYLGSNDSIREVACWAHARRKFFDARHSSPRDTHQVLEWIRQLYDVEERARELSVDARRKMRAAEAAPVLDRIGARLAELEKRVLPKSVLSKAVSYASNQWQALRRYAEDGQLSIDNNVSERTLRQQAIGRKNWLFLGSEQVGPRAAVLFTVLAGAKRHRIEPWAYLRELLLRSSSTRGKSKKTKKPHYPFPNPYSHNPWHRSRGHSNRPESVGAAFEFLETQRTEINTRVRIQIRSDRTTRGRAARSRLRRLVGLPVSRCRLPMS